MQVPLERPGAVRQQALERGAGPAAMQAHLRVHASAWRFVDGHQRGLGCPQQPFVLAPEGRAAGDSYLAVVDADLPSPLTQRDDKRHRFLHGRRRDGGCSRACDFDAVCRGVLVHAAALDLGDEERCLTRRLHQTDLSPTIRSAAYEFDAALL